MQILQNSRKILKIKSFPNHRYYQSLSAEEKKKFIKFNNGEDEKFLNDITIIPNFLSPEEEKVLLDQSSALLSGRRFQKQHWDNVITGYREVERHESLWNPSCHLLFSRVKSLLPNNSFLDYVHVLELNKEGEIFPHVDNTEAFGSIICTVCLESDCVMTFEHTSQNNLIHVYLPRYSLYIIDGHARYSYKHSILNGDYEFEGKKIIKEKRISVIFRSTHKPTE